MEWEVCLSLQGGQRKENVTLRLDYSDAEWTFHRVRVGGQSMTCRFLTGGTHLKVAAFDCGSDEEELASVATAMAEGRGTGDGHAAAQPALPCKSHIDGSFPDFKLSKS